MSVPLGYTRKWWPGLVIVLSSLCGAPGFGGLGESFLWGRDKIVCVKTVNLVVCRGGLSQKMLLLVYEGGTYMCM